MWCRTGNLVLFIALFIVPPNMLFAILEGINALSSSFPWTVQVSLMNSCAKCRVMWAVLAILIFPSYTCIHQCWTSFTVILLKVLRSFWCLQQPFPVLASLATKVQTDTDLHVDPSGWLLCTGSMLSFFPSFLDGTAPSLPCTLAIALWVQSGFTI